MDASLAFAVELEQRDEEVAARIGALAELAGRVEGLRRRAGQVAAFRERLPADREHLRSALAEVEPELAGAREALAEAERALERARGEDARATARRHAAHAASDLHTTEERLARLIARRDALSREELETETEAAAVAAAAEGLATELARTPRVAAPAPPAPGLAGVLEWTASAHAAVLVVRSGLETERERVVREANELAASVLGEPLYATSVAAVRRRLEGRLS